MSQFRKILQQECACVTDLGIRCEQVFFADVDVAELDVAKFGDRLVEQRDPFIDGFASKIGIDGKRCAI